MTFKHKFIACHTLFPLEQKKKLINKQITGENGDKIKKTL